MTKRKTPTPDEQRRADLELLRKGLLAAFDECEPSVKAQIAGQLRAVVKDLAALGPAKTEVHPADEIAARRANRKGTTAGRAGTPDRAPAARRSQPRRRAGGDRAR